MADRFQRLFTLTPNLYIEGCPVIIEAGALLKDTESGSVLAQVKMRNIGEEVVSSCRVSIKAFATNGDEVEGVSDFSYLDLNAGRGREFGSKTPVMLPDKTARKIAVKINEIVYSDGTVKKMDSNEWKTIPKQKTLGEILQDQEFVKQYKLETGESAEFLPVKKDGLFLCTCGAVNLESADKCYKCGNSYENLVECLDENYLLSKTNERKNKESADKAKQQAFKKKSIKIIAAVCVAILLIIIAAKAVGVKKATGMYAMLQGNIYTLDNGYDTATLTFYPNNKYTLVDDRGSKTVEYEIVKAEDGDGYEINKKGEDWYSGDMLYIDHVDGNQIKEIWSEWYLDNLKLKE